MRTARVVVIGSTNTDLVVTVPRLPVPGETVLGGDLRQVAGGKGANQAVAAARLGSEVTFIGRVGDDDYGRHTLRNLQSEGIDTQHLRVTSGVPSGTALISVHELTGENSIVVAPGANARLTPEDIAAAAEAIEAAQVVVVSLEIPLDAVRAAVSLARLRGRLVILNPAPAQSLAFELLAQVDVLTPNEQELETLGGISRMLDAGVGTVITTLGARGARLQTTSDTTEIPAPRVTVVDTVAAGDCFTGALAVELARGTDLPSAARFATTAASLKVTQHGAQPGMPTRAEVLSRLPIPNQP